MQGSADPGLVSPAENDKEKWTPSDDEKVGQTSVQEDWRV